MARASMAWSPTVWAVAMARSANGTDSRHRPASIRTAARPACTRACPIEGGSPSSKATASCRSRMDVGVSPASRLA